MALPFIIALTLEGTLPMSCPGSVTYWVGQLKEGDADAAQCLWEAYFQRLLGLVQQEDPRHRPPREGRKTWP